jgi:hypothetical protein
MPVKSRRCCGLSSDWGERGEALLFLASLRKGAPFDFPSLFCYNLARRHQGEFEGEDD